MKNRTIWINAGEVSGDMQGEALLRAMRRMDPGLRFTGMGGPRLAAAGMEVRRHIEELSVMGITEVIRRLPRIARLLGAIRRDLGQILPDALIAIDAPDFNFRVIRAARSLGIPCYYHISPKLWAWRSGRAAFIKKNVRRLTCILPFEVEFYRRFGMEVDYVGNPLVDIVDYPSLAHIAPQPGLICLMPGSRPKETSALMPEFGKAAHIMQSRAAGLSFACIRAPGTEQDALQRLWPSDVPLEFVGPERRFAFMRKAELLIAASGTATLESALLGVPTVICYKVSPISFAIGKMLVKTRFVGLPNLILQRKIFPELLQKDCDAGPLADAVLALLSPQDGTNPLEEMRAGLPELRRLMGEPGAADRAAAVILEDLASCRGEANRGTGTR
ncbi:MAG: lipid-A-disaccharide synthase [Desulfovibrio sp.]|nr:lipid-A-disaccharide synthase [Desulfovibrio sp.]